MNNHNLVLDVGNTHIVVGIYEQDTLIHSWRISTDKSKTEDEYFAFLKLLTLENNIDLKKVRKAALASVVPDLSRLFSHMTQKYLNCDLIVVDAYTDLGLTYPMDDPGFVGADLVVNAFAAKEKYKTNCIVCDYGTATTIQLVGADGQFYGTVIAPGVLTASSSLFQKAAKISNIKLEAPATILGTSTKDALLSGILTGNTLMLDGFIRTIREEYKHLGDIKAIATGGISGLICENSKEIDVIDKTLTLDGLNLICRR